MTNSEDNRLPKKNLYNPSNTYDCKSDIKIGMTKRWLYIFNLINLKIKVYLNVSASSYDNI